MNGRMSRKQSGTKGGGLGVDVVDIERPADYVLSRSDRTRQERQHQNHHVKRHRKRLGHYSSRHHHPTLIEPTKKEKNRTEQKAHPEVPRIDLKCFSHITRDTHKLRQNQWTLLALLLCEYEFHTRGVHTVSQRSDHAEIGYTEESVEFVLLDSLVAENVCISTFKFGL